MSGFSSVHFSSYVVNLNILIIIKVAPVKEEVAKDKKSNNKLSSKPTSFSPDIILC